MITITYRFIGYKFMKEQKFIIKKLLFDKLLLVFLTGRQTSERINLGYMLIWMDFHGGSLVCEPRLVRMMVFDELKK